MRKTDLAALVMGSKRFFVTLLMVLLFSSSLIIPTANSSGSAVSYPVHLQTTETGTVTITTTNPGGGALSFEGISSVAKTNIVSTWSEDSSGAQPYYSMSSLSSVAAAIPGLWLDSSNRKRRSRSQIYVEILELMKQRGPMTPFEIALYARLNHKRTKECLEFLELCGYQETVREEDQKIVNVLTKEGIAFLERARALFQSKTPASASQSASVTTVGR